MRESLGVGESSWMGKRVSGQSFFARCRQARAEGIHESTRNGDCVSQQRFKGAWQKVA
jgi:hypothetical protein